MHAYLSPELHDAFPRLNSTCTDCRFFFILTSTTTVEEFVNQLYDGHLDLYVIITVLLVLILIVDVGQNF